jgi:predicted RND superfamily exporter protein
MAAASEPRERDYGMMERFFTAVVRHFKLVVAAFGVAAALCGVCAQLVQVDYDINDYLPAGTPSMTAVDVMGAEFDGGIPGTRLMVPDVTITEALALKDRFAAVAGVEDVTWLDDAADTRLPTELMSRDTLETYYKDGNALFSLTLDPKLRIDALPQLRELAGPAAALTGVDVSIVAATMNTVDEVRQITLVVVAFTLLVLVLTTSTWLEPFIVLLGLGVAVVINAGTNLAFGSISFVTNSAGSILQLAIALDFSVFLLHRFHECRGSTGSIPADMVTALRKSGTAIFASGLTVTFGFLALTVMRFRIGPDLGFALAKGLAISLLTVFTLVPALLVGLDRLSARTRHRAFLPGFGGFGTLVRKTMVPAAGVLVLITVPAFLAASSPTTNYWYGASHMFGPDTPTGSETRRIETVFGKSDTYVLLVPRGDLVRERALSSELRQLPEVTGVISYVDLVGAGLPPELVPAQTLEKLESEQHSRMVLTLRTDTEGAHPFALVERVRAIAQQHYPDGWELAGAGVVTYDLRNTTQNDKDLVDVIAVLAVLAVLFFATRSLLLPFLLVLVIETSIWLNFAVPYFTSSPLFYLAYLICSAIQLGVTVDYAILFADRYKELRQRLGKGDAVRETVRATAQPILTSGSVLMVCGLVMGEFSTHELLSQLGFFLSRGTALSLVAVFLALPGLLYLFDPLIARTTWRANFTDGAAGRAKEALSDAK